MNEPTFAVCFLSLLGFVATANGQVELIAEFPAPDGELSSQIRIDGDAVVTTTSRSIRGFDLMGNELWETGVPTDRSGNGFPPTFSVASDGVYVAADLSLIHI